MPDPRNETAMLRYMFMLPDGWAERIWVIIDIVSPDAPDDSYCRARYR